jgi:hypothetical protein
MGQLRLGRESGEPPSDEARALQEKDGGMTFPIILQWVSIVTAFGAAIFWLWSAAIDIPPGVVSIWEGNKRIKEAPLPAALKRAARLSAKAAACAAISAAAQGVSLYLTMPISN